MHLLKNETVIENKAGAFCHYYLVAVAETKIIINNDMRYQKAGYAVVRAFNGDRREGFFYSDYSAAKERFDCFTKPILEINCQ